MTFFKKILKKTYTCRKELFGDINEFKEFLIKKKYRDFLPENLNLLQKFEKELKEKLMKELSLKDELSKEDLKRILNNLDLKKI